MIHKYKRSDVNKAMRTLGREGQSVQETIIKILRDTTGHLYEALIALHYFVDYGYQWHPEIVPSLLRLFKCKARTVHSDTILHLLFLQQAKASDVVLHQDLMDLIYEDDTLLRELFISYLCHYHPQKLEPYLDWILSDERSRDLQFRTRLLLYALKSRKPND